MQKICETCGASFVIEPYRAATARFCSRACQGIAKRTGKTIMCAWCEKEFYSNLATRRFCSWECFADIERHIDRRPDGCWIFGHRNDENSYGITRRAESDWMAVHRFVYEKYKGPIPDGLQLDHLCRVRSCVNPDHLEPVTNQINVCRAPKVIAARAALCCRHGHEWTPENTYIQSSSGTRVCRKCVAESQRRYQERKMANAR